MLTRYSPVRHCPQSEASFRLILVRLACVKHAASVRPEPGSNSLKNISFLSLVQSGFESLLIDFRRLIRPNYSLFIFQLARCPGVLPPADSFIMISPALFSVKLFLQIFLSLYQPDFQWFGVIIFGFQSTRSTRLPRRFNVGIVYHSPIVPSSVFLLFAKNENPCSKPFSVHSNMSFRIVWKGYICSIFRLKRHNLLTLSAHWFLTSVCGASATHISRSVGMLHPYFRLDSTWSFIFFIVHNDKIYSSPAIVDYGEQFLEIYFTDEDSPI